MINSEENPADKESKRELHDSGRSSPCEDHSSSTGQVVEVKVTIEEGQVDDQHQKKKQQRKVTASANPNAQTHSFLRLSRKGMNAHESKPPAAAAAALSREAERRAAVLERRRKQEEELKARMDQLRIKQEARLNRAAATMQMDPAIRRAQLLGKHPTKNATNVAPKPPSGSRSLPTRIQAAVERLSVPKYRREENAVVATTGRMAQSMNSAALSAHLKTAKQPTSSPARRRDNVMSLSFTSKSEQTRKARAKSHADKPAAGAHSAECKKSADEIEYKRKLEEKRKIAREKQEKERQRQEQERLKREEEEQRAQLERIRQQEEALRLEEEALKKAIEEKEKAEAALKEKEEKERQAKAEQERLHMEETKRLEAERQARLVLEEEERQMRKKKINDILSSHRSQAVTSDRQSLLTSATESVNLFFNNELISNTTSQVLQTYFKRPRSSDLSQSETANGESKSPENGPTKDIVSEQQPPLVNGKGPESSGEMSA